MSLGFSLLIKNKIIDESILLREVNKYCKTDIVLKQGQDKNIIKIDEIYSKEGLIITLVKNVTGPYNIHDSNIFTEEFEYEQGIYFDFDKEKDLNDLYLKALQISFGLMSLHNEEAILTSNFTEDICYFTKNSSVLINKNIPFLEQDFIKKITNRNVKFTTDSL